MSYNVKRKGNRLEVTSLFGTRWEFHPTIAGEAVGILAFDAGNMSEEADVRAGLGPEQSVALRDYLVEQLGAPEGYVKATEVQAPEVHAGFKPGDRVKITVLMLRGYGQPGTLVEYRDGHDYKWKVVFDDGDWVPVELSEIERYVEPEPVKRFKEGDRVRILDSSALWASGQVGTVARPAMHLDYWVKLDDGRPIAVWDKEIEPYVEPERVYKFKVGDKVKVTHDHRNGQVGTVSEVDPKGKHYPFHYDYNVKFDEPGAPLGESTLGYNEDELEEYREPTNKEVRDALPNGSVIRFNDESNTWHKVAGKWMSSRYETLELAGTYNAPLWTQHVLFDPSKKQED